MIPIYDFDQVSPEEIFSRETDRADVSGAVAAIIADVRQKRRQRPAALRPGLRPRGAHPPSRYPGRPWRAAALGLDSGLRAVMEEAAANIRDFHRRQRRESFVVSEKDGVILGQKITPIEKVGLYIPGGTAAYPSSVLMNAIPAKLAGCREIVMVSPPTCGGDVNPVILAAAYIAGVDRVFRCGGAQAVAALGLRATETVCPGWTRSWGPGNAYVAEAKRQVFGQVAIDMIAGPSEILVVADGKSNPKWVAADLLSQAEHDKMASAVLVTDDMALAQAVQSEIERQLPALPRADHRPGLHRGEPARSSSHRTSSGPWDVANQLAPEHLELCVDQPSTTWQRSGNAGSIFLGRNCPEALGDYLAGPQPHPAHQRHRPVSPAPLSVDDFVKKSQFTYYTAAALEAVQGKIAAFARQEGLEAHARSAEIRFETEGGDER